jgi:hypothetical protein
MMLARTQRIDFIQAGREAATKGLVSAEDRMPDQMLIVQDGQTAFKWHAGGDRRRTQEGGAVDRPSHTTPIGIASNGECSVQGGPIWARIHSSGRYFWSAGM